jgi:hypothetical protein
MPESSPNLVLDVALGLAHLCRPGAAFHRDGTAPAVLAHEPVAQRNRRHSPAIKRRGFLNEISDEWVTGRIYLTFQGSE